LTYRQYQKKLRNMARMKISHDWLSCIIQVDIMIWGHQNKDGKTNSIFKIKRNRPYWN